MRTVSWRWRDEQTSTATRIGFNITYRKFIITIPIVKNNLDHFSSPCVHTYALHIAYYPKLQTRIKRITTHNSPLIPSSTRDITKVTDITTNPTTLRYHHSRSHHPSILASPARPAIPRPPASAPAAQKIAREKKAPTSSQTPPPPFNHLQKLQLAPVGKMRATYCLQ